MSKTLAEKFLEKATFKSVVEIDYGDLDNIITEHFTGKKVPYTYPYEKDFEPHDIVCLNEWSNDSQHSFDVKKIAADEKIIKNAKLGKWPEYNTDELLNKMCFDGIIPECELIVSIYW
jgi:hypothetical protein